MSLWQHHHQLRLEPMNHVIIFKTIRSHHLTALNVKMLSGYCGWDRIKVVEVSQLGRHEAEGVESREKTQREDHLQRAPGSCSDRGRAWNERNDGWSLSRVELCPRKNSKEINKGMAGIQNWWRFWDLRDRPRMKPRTMASFVLYCPIIHHYTSKEENGPRTNNFGKKCAELCEIQL